MRASTRESTSGAPSTPARRWAVKSAASLHSAFSPNKGVRAFLAGKDERDAAGGKGDANEALEGERREADMDAVADEEADAHRGDRCGAEDERVERELADRLIARAARDADGEDHRRHGGAEGVLRHAGGVEVDREEDGRHRAEHRADDAGEHARRRPQRFQLEARLPPRVRRVEDDEDAERARKERRVERLEDEEAGDDAERAAGKQTEILAPVDVRAAAADDRDRGHDADQAPGGRQDLHRDGKSEERQSERAAEAKRAAQREVEEQNRGAVGELERGKGLEQAPEF